MTHATANASGRPGFLKSHCKHGHAFTQENTRIKRRGERECIECARIRTRNQVIEGRISERKVREIVTAVQDGMTLSRVTGKAGNRFVGGAIINAARLFNFLKRNPKLAKILREQSRKNYSASRVIRTAAPAIFRNDGAEAFNAIQAATRHLLEPIRGTVQSDMWLDVSEGRLPIRQIGARAQDYVRKYHRDEKHSVASRWGNRSLDAPIGDDGFSLLDTIADTGAWSPIATNNGRLVSTRNWQ